jgi:hypothetical protein
VLSKWFSPRLSTGGLLNTFETEGYDTPRGSEDLLQAVIADSVGPRHLHDRGLLVHDRGVAGSEGISGCAAGRMLGVASITGREAGFRSLGNGWADHDATVD